MSAKKTVMRGSKVFCVGVTGHRPNRMPATQWDRIKQDLAGVMAEIEASHPGRRLILLSGLAEGADRLSAFVALGRGWALRSILAFHRTRFEHDFPQPFAIGEFRALLAASEGVVEPKKSAQFDRPEDGYDAVGRRIVVESDILIAVWDGAASQGKGGTVEVMAQARACGTPVVWVHARKAQAPRTLQAAKASSARRSRAPVA
jgi:hypothetical protein